MTLTTTHNRIAYTAGGGSGVFAYTFLVLAASDLRVYLDSVLQPGSAYSVSGVGLGSGGNVTLTAVPLAGVKVVILRATEPTQQINLVEGDRLPAESIELSVFDKAYALIQDMTERLLRAIKVPESSANAAIELALPDPALTANQNKALFINGSGALEARTILSTDVASPITTKGDLIQGSNGGSPEALAIGTVGQVLTVAAGKAAWAAAGTGAGALLQYAGAPYATVANTAAETSIFSPPPTIVGGTLSTARALRIKIHGDILNNTGGGAGFILRTKYGATTIVTLDAVGAISASATRRGWRAEVLLAAAGATGAQTADGVISFNTSVGVAGASGGNSTDIHASTHTGVVENSAIDQALDITIDPDAASANLSIRVFSVQVEVIR